MAKRSEADIRRLDREKRQRLLRQQQRDADAGITPEMRGELESAMSEAGRRWSDAYYRTPHVHFLPHQRSAAKRAAASAVRDDILARWAREKAAKDAEAAAFPPHITRMAPGDLRSPNSHIKVN